MKSIKVKTYQIPQGTHLTLNGLGTVTVADDGFSVRVKKNREIGFYPKGNVITGDGKLRHLNGNYFPANASSLAYIVDLAGK